MSTRRLYIMVVLLSALIVAFEAVTLEAAINIAGLNLFLVSSVPLIVGGFILIGARPRASIKFAKGLDAREWVFFVFLCIFVALGVILWFDSVSRIGAGKESILGGGSSEVLFIVILSAVFLGERLNRIEVLGSLLVVVGVFLVLANTETLSLTFGFGEMEAIMSSFSLGVSVVMTAMLLKRHDLTPLSGWELLFSGTLMIVFGTASGLIEWPSGAKWLLVLGLGALPAAGLLAYNAGLPRIGASLTSVLFALTGVMTVGVQLTVLFIFPDADMILPQSVLLALVGGLVALIGVYLLNLKPTAEVSAPAGGALAQPRSSRSAEEK